MSKKNSRTKAQGIETKMQIYRCAQELFRQNDYNDISVNTITKMAGVSKGTFYVHFESKDALYIDIITHFVEHLDAQYGQFLETLPPEMSSYDRMLELVKIIIDLMVTQVGYENLKTLYKLQISKTVSTEVVTGYNRKLYSLFEQVLERGILQGEFISELTLEDLTRHFVMAIRGITYEWCIRKLNFDFRQEVYMHIRLLLDALV